jgi:hypothetical protein
MSVETISKMILAEAILVQRDFYHINRTLTGALGGRDSKAAQVQA